MINIIIDGLPIAKGRGRVGKDFNGNPTIFTPANTRNYENLVRLKASEVMRDKAPLDIPLYCIIEVRLPVPASWSKKKQAEALNGRILPVSRPDLDNYIKSALDGLNGVAFRDDSLIVRLCATKKYSDKPCLMIFLLPNGSV